jgi:hypothetical protein
MARLWQPARQLMHGYLCYEEPADERIARWTRQITDCALRSGYEPGSIFMDHDPLTSGVARGGFIELLAALRLPEAYGVVVPSLAHLSTDTFVQQTLLHMVQLTNSQVLVASVPDNNSSHASLPLEPRAAS